MKNILSVFDGMSCCQVALKRLGYKDYVYYASEVDINAMRVSMHNFPNTVQLGDIRNIKSNTLPKMWMMVGGSPCQSFSLAGKRKGMVTEENIEVTSLSQYLKLKKSGFSFQGQSYLFWEYVRLLKELKPKYFLLENVRMDKKWEEVITKSLGVNPIKINSSMVSAQNRERLYWTNIPDIVLPRDKGILLTDIIKGAKSYGIRGRKEKKGYKQVATTRTDGKSNCLVTSPDRTGRLIFPNGTTRVITVPEAEKLQTLPVGYTNVKNVSKTQKFKMIGNGWTVDVITHLLKPITKKKLVRKPKPQ